MKAVIHYLDVIGDCREWVKSCGEGNTVQARERGDGKHGLSGRVSSVINIPQNLTGRKKEDRDGYFVTSCARPSAGRGFRCLPAANRLGNPAVDRVLHLVRSVILLRPDAENEVEAGITEFREKNGGIGSSRRYTVFCIASCAIIKEYLLDPFWIVP